VFVVIRIHILALWDNHVKIDYKKAASQYSLRLTLSMASKAFLFCFWRSSNTSVCTFFPNFFSSRWRLASSALCSCCASSTRDWRI
jgi:hypothetical protein